MSEINYNPSETGVIDDYRSDEEKEKDFRVEEIDPEFAEAPVINEKPLAQIKFYGIRDQGHTGTCVPQAGAKMMGIEVKDQTGDFAEFSATYLYQRRVNKPSHGMAMHDIMNLSKDKGYPFESIMVSQKLGSYEAADEVNELAYVGDVANLFRAKAYLYLPHSFNAIAKKVIEGYPVMIFIFANRDEYHIKPEVKDRSLTTAGATIRHAITCVDVVKHKGEEYIVADESWGIINNPVNDEFEEGLRTRGQRILSRDFIDTRVYSATYFETFEFRWSGERKIPNEIKFSFSENLQYGQRDNSQVKDLQDMLRYEGFFPSNVDSTGNYFAITASSVLKWQKHHNVADRHVLDSLKGHHFGPASRAKVKEIY